MWLRAGQKPIIFTVGIAPSTWTTLEVSTLSDAWPPRAMILPLRQRIVIVSTRCRPNQRVTHPVVGLVGSSINSVPTEIKLTHLARSRIRKTASRRSLRNPIRFFGQAAAIAAAFFRFLRQPSKPNAPSPEAKSGRAAGKGVPRLEELVDWISMDRSEYNAVD